MHIILACNKQYEFNVFFIRHFEFSIMHNLLLYYLCSELLMLKFCLFLSDVTHKIEPIDRLKDHSILTIQPCIEYEVKLHIEFEVRKLSFYQNLGMGNKILFSNKIYVFGTLFLYVYLVFLGEPNI